MRNLKLAILFFVMLAASVFAIDTKSFKDWEYVCPEKDSKACFLSHIVADKSGKSLVMQVVVGKIKESKSPVIGFQLPPILKSGQEINVALDNDVLMTLDIKNCNEHHCQALGALTHEFLKEFKTSNAGIVQFQSDTDKLVKIYFSLEGFTSAYNYFDKHASV